MILLPAMGSQLIVTTSLFLMPLLIDTLKVHAGLSGKIAGFLLSMELAGACLRGSATIPRGTQGLLARERGFATGMQRSLDIVGFVLLGIGIYLLLTNGLAMINYGRFAPHNG